MTTTTLTAPAPDGFARIVNVARLHFVNKGQIIVVPWLIMSFIFAVTLVIGWILRSSLPAKDLADAGDGMQYSGAIGYFLVYMLVIAVMAINQTFPFAQSYSVTRRDFYLGTIVAFATLSLAYSVAVTLLGWIEDVTNGWGVGTVLFSPGYLSPNLFERFYVAFVLFLFFFMMGIAVASVYVRWRVNGMLVFFASLALVILGLVAFATVTSSWGAVGAWFVAMGFLGVVSWTLAPTALATLVGYVLLRRATPRN
ncbi:MAG: ABC transporter permease [Microbacteriaceae bacterium]|nr:ABC transporter permease [Microbacteriaceae bacterium]